MVKVLDLSLVTPVCFDLDVGLSDAVVFMECYKKNKGFVVVPGDCRVYVYNVLNGEFEWL